MQIKCDEETVKKLVHAAVRAHAELNEIRARDGVPYTYYGMKASVDPESFSNVVDSLSDAVIAATGKPAHCHPFLYLSQE